MSANVLRQGHDMDALGTSGAVALKHGGDGNRVCKGEEKMRLKGGRAHYENLVGLAQGFSSTRGRQGSLENCDLEYPGCCVASRMWVRGWQHETWQKQGQ